MSSRGIISAYNTSLGFGIVDMIESDGTAKRHEITHEMLPANVAGLRAGQKVDVSFRDDDVVERVKPIVEAEIRA